MTSADTIFALSSGAPPAAIAIMRISGPAAFDILRGLSGRLPTPRRASLCSLRSPETQEILDQALVLVFPGPDTATGENLVELHLHGGRAVVRAVENAIEHFPGVRRAEAGEFTRRAFANGRMDLNEAFPGVRRAEAGEFTRRAFANGRMDLNEAEGLADLLSAETEWQRRAATQMFGGAFSAAVEEYRQEVLRLSALTEAELDFSDEGDVESQNNILISDGCAQLQQKIAQLLARPPAEKLKDGIRVVLAGPPNSGKSTLLNALVGREAAIVSDIAGTTRDMIEVPVAVEGVALLFTDTAGLRDDSDDAIERIGIDRSHAAMQQADILLWLGPENTGPNHSQIIEISSKNDIPDYTAKSPSALSVSAQTGTGISALLQLVAARHQCPAKDIFGRCCKCACGMQ